MEKEFVTMDLDLRLKAIGFDEPCFGYHLTKNLPYVKKGLKFGSEKYVGKHNSYNDFIVSAPTFSQAFRWFREKHNMPCKIEAYQEDLKVNAYYYFYQIQTSSHIVGFGIQHNLTYEEAELACLTKLIEIVESKSE